MPAPFEIKASLTDHTRIRGLAEALSGPPGVVIHQEETFFPVAKGRRKLRVVIPTGGELMGYA